MIQVKSIFHAKQKNNYPKKSKKNVHDNFYKKSPSERNNAKEENKSKIPLK